MLPRMGFRRVRSRLYRSSVFGARPRGVPPPPEPFMSMASANLAPSPRIKATFRGALQAAPAGRLRRAPLSRLWSEIQHSFHGKDEPSDRPGRSSGTVRMQFQGSPVPAESPEAVFQSRSPQLRSSRRDAKSGRRLQALSQSLRGRIRPKASKLVTLVLNDYFSQDPHSLCADCKSEWSKLIRGEHSPGHLVGRPAIAGGVYGTYPEDVLARGKTSHGLRRSATSPWCFVELALEG